MSSAASADWDETFRRALSARHARGVRLPNFRKNGGFVLATEDGVKLAAIAVDYDGTIAAGDALDPCVRNAIGVARQRGIAVILVTGRRLSDLRRVAGDLGCFDAVVCENGSVLEFPASGQHVALAHAPAAAFRETLERDTCRTRPARWSSKPMRSTRRPSSRPFARCSCR